MARVTLYTTPFCGYCHAAKRLLAGKAIDFEEIDVAFDAAKREEMMQRAMGRATVPQIFIGDQAIGGYVELAALEREGKLDGLIAASADPAAPETLVEEI